MKKTRAIISIPPNSVIYHKSSSLQIAAMLEASVSLQFVLHVLCTCVYSTQCALLMDNYALPVPTFRLQSTLVPLWTSLMSRYFQFFKFQKLPYTVPHTLSFKPALFYIRTNLTFIAKIHTYLQPYNNFHKEDISFCSAIFIKAGLH